MYRKIQIGISGLIVSCIWFNTIYQSNNLKEETKEMEYYTDIVL